MSLVTMPAIRSASVADQDPSATPPSGRCPSASRNDAAETIVDVRRAESALLAGASPEQVAAATRWTH